MYVYYEREQAENLQKNENPGFSLWENYYYGAAGIITLLFIAGAIYYNFG